VSHDQWSEFKERVRDATDIVDLLEGYMTLRRQGRGFVGLCPWHDDRRPSLQINPERQSFRCFVCDIGGDVFNFVMLREGLEFVEAVHMLAERAGIASPATGKRAAEPGTPQDKKTLYQAMAWAEQQFHHCLLHDQIAAPAREYLANRNISPQTIARFRLGFAPHSWDWLLKSAADTPYSPPVLAQVGLVAARDGGGHYDRFRGRVMFPIRDAQSSQSRTIAFGGRILPQFAQPDGDPVAKYINSPDTPLFSKNRQLYGLDAARDAVMQRKEVVVVEGYTDCLMAHQCGVDHVSAVLGTALGEQHVRLLRRLADRVVLVLDGDEAGQRRTNEILELFVAQQLDLRILTLPENLDPCDFLVSHGSEAFLQQLESAVDALEHKIRVVTQGLDPSVDTHRANVALEEILATLARAPRLTEKTSAGVLLREQQVLARLSRRFDASEDVLRKRLTELRRKARRPRRQADAPVGASYALEDIKLCDRMLIEALLAQPARLPEAQAALEPRDLASPLARKIYSKMIDLAAAGYTPDFDRLMIESEDAGMKDLLVKLDEERAGRNVGPAEELQDVIASFQRRKEDARYRRLFHKDEPAASPEEQEQQLGVLLSRLRARHDGSTPTDG